VSEYRSASNVVISYQHSLLLYYLLAYVCVCACVRVCVCACVRVCVCVGG
jgi:hypothetical protein